MAGLPGALPDLNWRLSSQPGQPSASNWRWPRTTWASFFATTASWRRQKRHGGTAWSSSRSELALEFPARPAIRIELAMAQNNLGKLLCDDGKLEEAEAAWRDCLELFQI